MSVGIDADPAGEFPDAPLHRVVCDTCAVDLINPELTVIEAGHRLDASGHRCPMPLLLAKRALRELPPGAVLDVMATDPGSVRDFAAFARVAGHSVTTETLPGGLFRHRIIKAD